MSEISAALLLAARSLRTPWVLVLPAVVRCHSDRFLVCHPVTTCRTVRLAPGRAQRTSVRAGRAPLERH